jgi:hypothetical protein
MQGGEPSPRTYTLRRAVSIVFGLVAVLPLLLFAYTIYAVGALRRADALMALGASIAFVLLGSYILRGITVRMAEQLRAAQAAAAGVETPALPDTGYHLPGFGTIHHDEPAREHEAIRESDMMAAAVAQLRAVWEAEAQPYLGQRVLVSVRNSSEPVIGALSQIAPDGLLLLGDGGKRIGVGYRRISAIDPDRVAEARSQKPEAARS